MGRTDYHTLNNTSRLYSTAWGGGKTCLLIDTGIPDDSNANTKENEKLSKFKDLEMEVSRMWKVRTTVPVMTEALGTIN